jgi:RimJ/RimL family protein N-acetyltransferase
MIGTCDFPSIDWTNKTATLGYCMHSAYWGKGYMTKVVKQVLDFAFDYLGMETIRVQHHPNNIGSKRVIEKVGFVYQKQSYNPSLKMELPTYVIQKNRASIS